MYGSNHEPMFSCAPEPDKYELMDHINLLSATIFKILGVDAEDEIKCVKSNNIKFFMPGFNDKHQLTMPLKTYIGLDRNIQKILRDKDMVSVTTDNKDILNLIDEIEDAKNG